MSDLGTQLRSYFDDNVERVTPEDVFAGRHVGDLTTEPRFKWRASPRFAVGLGFAATVLVIGGSLGLGLVLRQPGDVSSSGRMTLGIGDGTPESTGWWLVGTAAVLAAIAIVFIVLAMRSTRTSSRRKREEETMATTFETQDVDHELDDAHRANRWLIAAVVVLAVAVVVLGAWIVNDLTTTSTTEVPTEIEAMLDGYTGAWDDYDGDAFLGYIREMDYVHTSSFGTYNAAETATLINGGETYGTRVESLGEPIYVGAGSTAYVVRPGRISWTENPEGNVGFSIFKVIDWSDNGWVVVRHDWIGQTGS